MTRNEHLLTVAAEECNETAQRIDKALRFGMDDIQNGQLFSNAERLVQEFRDLQAAIEMLEDAGMIPPTVWIRDAEAIEGKKDRVEAFLLYSEKRGCLTKEPTTSQSEAHVWPPCCP